MSLEFTVTKVGAVAVVTIKGRIVAGPNAEALVAKVQELVQGGETRVILDLAQVTYLDSTGISALIRAAAVPGMVGGSTKLLNLTKRITDTLQITRLSSGFEIFDDLAKAVASFGPESEAPSSPGAGPGN
jgi:anti-sigma B factor antagonist